MVASEISQSDWSGYTEVLRRCSTLAEGRVRLQETEKLEYEAATIYARRDLLGLWRRKELLIEFLREALFDVDANDRFERYGEEWDV